MRYILGIETAAGLSVAVTKEDRVAAECRLKAGRDLDSLLLETVKGAMEASGLRLEQLSAVAVSSGPGSFTGLRVGLAAAKGLALALGKPVAGVPTLDAMVFPFTPSADCMICPVLDARKGQVYSCIYKYRAETGTKERTTGYLALSLEELLRRISEKTFFLCAEQFREPVKSALGENSILMPPEYGSPKASSVALALLSRLEPDHPPGIYDLRPVYARKPDAEEKSPRETETTIGELRRGDIPGMLEIERASFPTPWSAEMFRTELRKEHSVFLTAKTGGEVAGYIGGWLICDEFHLANFAVSPKMRGRGIGTKLLQNLISRVKSYGASLITLEVRENNLPAIAMYRRNGFRASGRRKKYYGDSGEDAVIMSLREF